MRSWKEDNLLERVREGRKTVARNKSHLKELIEERIDEFGLNCDLNDIDVSQITDMSYMFENSEFNGDISSWDVSNVENMEGMFFKSKFNGDISNWDVSNVKNMIGMFARSSFNEDISNWDVSNVSHMDVMFYKSKFRKDISNWDVLYASKRDMFKGSPLEKRAPKWSFDYDSSMKLLKALKNYKGHN